MAWTVPAVAAAIAAPTSAASAATMWDISLEGQCVAQPATAGFVIRETKGATPPIWMTFNESLSMSVGFSWTGGSEGYWSAAVHAHAVGEQLIARIVDPASVTLQDPVVQLDPFNWVSQYRGPAGQQSGTDAVQFFGGRPVRVVGLAAAASGRYGYGFDFSAIDLTGLTVSLDLTLVGTPAYTGEDGGEMLPTAGSQGSDTTNDLASISFDGSGTSSVCP
ncbi:hypothetical protein HQQ80_20805 [Microbacteriaceae bacterium VKM Ac-2855]|nr:hypothetical protein [Microbacteriaceae bacterium VKM Ac-2855]